MAKVRESTAVAVLLCACSAQTPLRPVEEPSSGAAQARRAPTSEPILRDRVLDRPVAARPTATFPEQVAGFTFGMLKADVLRVCGSEWAVQDKDDLVLCARQPVNVDRVPAKPWTALFFEADSLVTVQFPVEWEFSQTLVAAYGHPSLRLEQDETFRPVAYLKKGDNGAARWRLDFGTIIFMRNAKDSGYTVAYTSTAASSSRVSGL